jgi:hypothetical protein
VITGYQSGLADKTLGRPDLVRQGLHRVASEVGFTLAGSVLAAEATRLIRRLRR